MSNRNELSETLNTVFTNPNFIRDVYSDWPNEDVARSRLATVLEYYIATRDTNTNYRYIDIEKRYKTVKKTKKAKENTQRHGFLLHACNGYASDWIKKYGLNYSIIPELQGEIIKHRRILEELEKLTQKSKWTAMEEDNLKKIYYPLFEENTIYVCSPGETIIEYAIANSPERLFNRAIKC